MSTQLKYTNDFQNIIPELLSREEETIPFPLIDYLKKILSSYVIYEEKKKNYRCMTCNKSLLPNKTCPKCQRKYEIDEWQEENILYLPDEQKEYRWTHKIYCYMFDDVNSIPILSLWEVEDQRYYNPFELEIFSKIEWERKEAFAITPNGFTDILENEFYSFEEYEKNIFLPDSMNENKEKYKKIKELRNKQVKYIYTENLEELKNTIYHHTDLWKGKEYLQKNEITFEQLIFFPLFYPQFEYLMKMKLYSLAFQSPYQFQRGKNFKEIFGIEKDYLEFMQQHQMSYEELQLLKIYPTKDKEVLQILKYIANYIADGTYLEDVSLDFTKIKNYLKAQKLSFDYIHEYLDYISMAKQLGLNIKENKVKYPKFLLESHNELEYQQTLQNNPKIDQKIQNLANILSWNTYEDEKYIITPASSMKSLLEESKEQHNCVRMYSERVSKNECQIYYLRKKEAKEKSFVTIEVRNNKVVQAREKYNQLPSKEIYDVLNRWEKTLIPIENEEE